MPGYDQDFKSFYQKYTQSQEKANEKQKLMRELNFDTVMSNGRA